MAVLTSHSLAATTPRLVYSAAAPHSVQGVRVTSTCCKSCGGVFYSSHTTVQL